MDVINMILAKVWNGKLIHYVKKFHPIVQQMEKVVLEFKNVQKLILMEDVLREQMAYVFKHQ